MRLSAFFLAAVAAAQTTPDALLPAGHYKQFRAIASAHAAEDAEGLYLKATVQQLFGSLDEAEKLAEKAIAANPKEARYHYRLAVIAGIKAQRASVLHQFGLARKFKREAEATLALDPNHVRTLDMMMTFYLAAPGVIGGDKAKAREVADRLMKIDPVEGYRAQMTMARFEKQDGRVEGLVRKSVEVSPGSWEAHIDLANWCTGQKKFDEAEREARAAIKIHPDRGGGYGMLAATLVHQGKWAELDGALAMAEKAAPENLIAYFRAGNTCLALKTELVRAEKYFRKYLGQEPEAESASLGAAHWRLGLVLEQEGRKAEAIGELQTAVKMDANLGAKADLKRMK